ncbi:TPA: hypothetical protein RHY41_004402 [Escherichia coli]|nr:hypothetical protein [Escherichia coli]HDV2374301.1 hypothetical protein [Escherichia coli]
MGNVVNIFDAKNDVQIEDGERAEAKFVETFKAILLQPRSRFALCESDKGEMCLWDVTGEKPKFYCVVGEDLPLFLKYDFHFLKGYDQKTAHLKKTMYAFEGTELTTWERMAALTLAFHADETGRVDGVTQKTLGAFYGGELKHFVSAVWNLNKKGLVTIRKHEETYTPNTYFCKWL